MVCGRGAAGGPIGRPAGLSTLELRARLRPARSREGLGCFGARIWLGDDQRGCSLGLTLEKLVFGKLLNREGDSWGFNSHDDY